MSPRLSSRDTSTMKLENCIYSYDALTKFWTEWIKNGAFTTRGRHNIFHILSSLVLCGKFYLPPDYVTTHFNVWNDEI